jgi:hypothetical protein
MEQRAYSFDKETLVKIAKGAGIAGGAAILTYLAEHLTELNFGAYTAIVVAVLSILINSGKEWLKGAKQ